MYKSCGMMLGIPQGEYSRNYAYIRTPTLNSTSVVISILLGGHADSLNFR